MVLRRASQSTVSQVLHVHHFHSSAIPRMPRKVGVIRTQKNVMGMPPISEDVIEKEAGDDTSVAGHLMLQQQRQALYYLRLIEHEMPKLVAYRKPFVPPSHTEPLVIRAVSYGGEPHPVEVKRTIVVPVSRLPLKDSAAIHKFKLLAGPRWTPDTPINSGIAHDEDAREHGYFKMACEDFPRAAMNLKWTSDTLDRLISEANDPRDKFEDVPLDTRHLEAKTRKAKKGDHVYGRGGHRPTLKDFPEEWLPNLNPKTYSSSL